jgi:hypothetical protein
MDLVSKISSTSVFCKDDNYAETHNFFISREDYKAILDKFKILPNETRKYANIYSCNFANHLLIKQMHEGLTPVVHICIRVQTSRKGCAYYEMRVKSTEPENRPEARHGCVITTDPQEDDLLWIRGIVETLAFFRVK